MRLIFIFLTLFFPTYSLAQSLNGPHSLSSGYSTTFNHSPSDRYEYIAYEVFLPSFSVGFIGFDRFRGTGNHDIRIGTSISPESYKRARLSGIVASDTTNDNSSDVLVFASDDFSADRFYIEAYSVDDRAGSWRLKYRTFHVGEKLAESFVKALGVTVIECMFTNCDGQQSDVERNIGRALTFGMSALTRDNVCSIGTDLITNEVMMELEREVGGGDFVITVLGFFISDFIDAGLSVQC